MQILPFVHQHDHDHDYDVSLLDREDGLHPANRDSLRCSYSCRQMVKSELLEKLDTQEKYISELESTVRSLKNRNDDAESQAKHLSLRVESLEQESAAAHGREKAAQTHFLQEMDQMEGRLRTLLKRCSELEIKLQEEMQQRAAAVARETAAENQLEFLRETKEKAAEAFEREISHLKQELDTVQKDFNFNISRARAEITAEKGRVQVAQAEAVALKAQCEGMQKRLSESMDAKRDLELKLANANNLTSPSRSHEDETIIRNLRDDLHHCESDVAEARRLKLFHASVDLLKEKLESERQRAGRAEAALEDLVDVQVQVSELEKELQDWRNMLLELPGVENRDDIPRKIADLQREAMSAVAEVGEVTARSKGLQVALEKAEIAFGQAEANANAAKKEAVEMITNVKRLERKVQLLSKERDGLKSIIDSYDEEDDIAKQCKPGENAVFSSTTDKTKTKRIEELEALVAALNREADTLRIEIAKLELKVCCGDYDPSTTKVLHMVECFDSDPEKQALQSEIQRLREKLELLGKKESSFGKVELLDIESGHYKELTALREQVASLEKLKARYKTVFLGKISEFRQACELLFGYQILMKEEQQTSTGITITRFTLQSIYAQTEEEKLEFQFESGHLNLLANDYTSSPDIARMVNMFLQKFKSIPAFTANLTVELFNKTSMC